MNAKAGPVGVLVVAAALLAGALFPGGCAGPAERPGAVTLKGKPITLLGAVPSVGQPAPAFTAVGTDLTTFDSASMRGKVWILSVVPSLDTPVCSLQTHRFSDEAAALGPKVGILTISMDLPFAQKRWCGAEGVGNVTTVSDFRDRAFGRAYGVLMKETHLLARSLFVVDAAGVLRHAQIVSEVAHQPDYAAALAAAKEAVGD